MKPEQLQKLTEEQLKSKIKSLGLMTGLLTGMLAVLFTVSLISTVMDKKFDMMLVVSIALIPIVFVNRKNHKEMKAELESRNAS